LAQNYLYRLRPEPRNWGPRPQKNEGFRSGTSGQHTDRVKKTASINEGRFSKPNISIVITCLYAPKQAIAYLYENMVYENFEIIKKYLKIWHFPTPSNTIPTPKPIAPELSVNTIIINSHKTQSKIKIFETDKNRLNWPINGRMRKSPIVLICQSKTTCLKRGPQKFHFRIKKIAQNWTEMTKTILG